MDHFISLYDSNIKGGRHFGITDEQLQRLQGVELVEEIDVEDDDDGNVLATIWEPAEWVTELVSYEEFFALLDELEKVVAIEKRSGARGPLSDEDAVTLINYMLSAPEWSVSYLEDISEIIERTGRSPVTGAYWASH